VTSSTVTPKLENANLVVDSGKLKIDATGHATIVSCLENPVPNTHVDWEVRDIGMGIKTKFP